MVIVPYAMICYAVLGGTFIFLPGKGESLSTHPKPGVKQESYIA